MPEPEPMTWKDAEWWEKQETMFAANTHIIKSALALARLEKARADKVAQQYEDAGREGFILADSLRVRAEKAEKERDEEISDDADFWEKKAAKAEQRAMILDDQVVLLTEQCQRLEARLAAAEKPAEVREMKMTIPTKWPEMEARIAGLLPNYSRWKDSLAMSALLDLRDQIQESCATLAKIERVASDFPQDRSLSLTIKSLRRRQKELELAFEEEADDLTELAAL